MSTDNTDEHEMSMGGLPRPVLKAAAVMNVTEPSDDGFPSGPPEDTQADLPYEEIAAELTPEQRRRVAALNEARDVLVGDLASQSSMFGGSQGGDKPYTTAKRYASDLLLVAGYIMEGLLSAEVEELTLPDYPYADGETIVLGPETFVSRDASTVNWRGVNYTRREG